MRHSVHLRERLARRPRSNAPRRHSGVEIRDAFDEHWADDLKEERAVKPVVTDAVAAVDGERDGEAVESEPAVEGEADFDRVAAPEHAEFDLLLLRVRAVGVYAVAVVDEEAKDGVVNAAVESGAHAKSQRRSRLDERGGAARGVEEFGARDLGAAVAMPVRVARRRARLFVFAL